MFAARSLDDLVVFSFIEGGRSNAATNEVADKISFRCGDFQFSNCGSGNIPRRRKFISFDHQWENFWTANDREICWQRWWSSVIVMMVAAVVVMLLGRFGCNANQRELSTVDCEAGTIMVGWPVLLFHPFLVSFTFPLWLFWLQMEMMNTMVKARQHSSVQCSVTHHWGHCPHFHLSLSAFQIVQRWMS